MRVIVIIIIIIIIISKKLQNINKSHKRIMHYKDENFIALIEINIALNLLPCTIIIIC